MKEIRYFYVPQATSRCELPEEEATHALRVLRLKAGDPIVLIDGEGHFVQAVVSMANNHHCFYDILSIEDCERTWGAPIHLAIAPTKMMERMEWLVEKAVEIGVDEISLLDCQYSERRQIRVDRLEKIVISAVKQSRKPWVTKVNPLLPFNDFIKVTRSGGLFIAHCYEEYAREDFFDKIMSSPCPAPITILIGPEGDFSVSEVEAALSVGYCSVTLGASRLRTETAGLSAVMMAQLALRTSSSFS